MKAFLQQTLGVIVVLALIPCGLVAAAQDLNVARTLVSKGQLSAALERARAYIQAHHDSVEARLLEGVILIRLDKPQAAIEAFQSLVALHPDIAEPHNNLAVLYARTGQLEAARQALERAVALQPDYGVAHENLGDVYAKLASLAYEQASTLGGSERATSKAEAVSELLEPGASRLIAAPRLDAMQVPAVANTEKVADEVTTQTAMRRSNVDAKACVTLGAGIAAGERVKMQGWLRARGAAIADVAPSSPPTPTTYVVFLPPGENRAEAIATIEELRAKGVQDLAHIPRGDLTHGVALGVFSSERSALRRRDKVRKLGYADVSYRQRGTRPQKTTTAVSVYELPADSAVKDAFEATFPEARLQPTECPRRRASN